MSPERGPALVHGDGARRALTGVMQESHQIATEHHDLAAHAHSAGAEHHGKQDRLTGHERSRLALEHSNHDYLLPRTGHQNTSTGVSITRESKGQDTAALAYRLWRARGCPQGSPEEDWFLAVEALRPQH